MPSPSSLIEQSRKRLVRQQRINLCGLYLPPLLATLVLGILLVREFFLSPVLTFLPALALTLWMGRALRRVGNRVETVTVAALIDEKAESQERFLTLATIPPTETTLPFLTLLRRQTEEKTITFSPHRAFPFVLDRRMFLTVSASALSLLIVFLLPLQSDIVPLTLPAPSQTQQELEKLATFARSLIRDGKTPQEKTAGVQLLALAEQLKDPTIPPEKQRQLIEETKQRLELPLPQILPFQLDLFASKDDKGKGNQDTQSQKDGKQQDKNKKNTDPTQTPQQSAAGNTQQQEQKEQPGSQQGSQKSAQQKPQESGGGVKFNQPQSEQQSEKRNQSGQDASGEQQKSDQPQSPDSRTQGTDPNRPGSQEGPGQDPQKQGPNPQPLNPQQPGQEQKGAGPTIGGSPGERFLKPGEQPGGFLTKDARFVKVRIPFGNAPQGEGENLTENDDRTQPKTPYSNAPLKEAPPDQIQLKQPVPLEYRTILK